MWGLGPWPRGLGLGAFLGALLALHGCEETKAGRTEKVLPDNRVAERNEPREFAPAATEPPKATTVGGGVTYLPGSENCPGIGGPIGTAPQIPDGKPKCFVPSEIEVYPGSEPSVAAPADEKALLAYLGDKQAQGFDYGCFDCTIRGCYGDQAARGGGLVFVHTDPTGEGSGGAKLDEVKAIDDRNTRIPESYGCGSTVTGERPEQDTKANCILVALWHTSAVQTIKRGDATMPKMPMLHCSKELKASVLANAASAYNAFTRDTGNDMNTMVNDPRQNRGTMKKVVDILYPGADSRSPGPGPPARPSFLEVLGDGDGARPATAVVAPVAKSGMAVGGTVVAQRQVHESTASKGDGTVAKDDGKGPASTSGEARVTGAGQNLASDSTASGNSQVSVPEKGATSEQAPAATSNGQTTSQKPAATAPAPAKDVTDASPKPASDGKAPASGSPSPSSQATDGKAPATQTKSVEAGAQRESSSAPDARTGTSATLEPVGRQEARRSGPLVTQVSPDGSILPQRAGK